MLFSDLLKANRSLAETLEALTTLRNIFISYHHWEDQEFYDKLAEVCANEFYPVADRSLEWPFDSEEQCQPPLKCQRAFGLGGRQDSCRTP
jgi:hypothetical protein